MDVGASGRAALRSPPATPWRLHSLCRSARARGASSGRSSFWAARRRAGCRPVLAGARELLTFWGNWCSLLARFPAWQGDVQQHRYRPGAVRGGRGRAFPIVSLICFLIGMIFALFQRHAGGDVRRRHLYRQSRRDRNGSRDVRDHDGDHHGGTYPAPTRPRSMR